jgi:hypothetical protein
MKLASHYAHVFSPQIRARGENCLKQGRVEVDAFTRDSVHASCEGDTSYFLAILKEENGFCLSCDCPYFESHGPCKHVYALLRIIDERAPDPTKLEFLRGAEAFGEVAFDIHEDSSEAFAMPRPDYEETLRRLRSGNNGHVEPTEASDWAAAVQRLRRHQHSPHSATPADDFEIHYMLDTSPLVQSSGHLRLRFCQRRRLKSGTWSKPRRLQQGHRAGVGLHDAIDREVLTLLRSAEPSVYDDGRARDQVTVPPAIDHVILPKLCKSGRFFRWDGESETNETVLHWNDTPPWQMRLTLSEPTPDGAFVFEARMHSGEQEMPLSEVIALLESDHVVFNDCVARAEHCGLCQAPEVFGADSELRVERSDLDAFLKALFALKHLPPLTLPASLDVTPSTPKPVAVLHALLDPKGDENTLFVDLRVAYGPVEIDPRHDGSALLSPDGQHMLLRDAHYEAGLERQLQTSGINIPPYAVHHPKHLYSVPVRNFPRAAETLMDLGWRVLAHGKPFRRVGEISFKVSSGVDWFDLNARCVFGDVSIGIPAILKAARAGESSVMLGDGSVGMLPEEWLEQHRYLLDSADIVDGNLRFKATQAMFLDALLLEQPGASCDETFQRVRDQLSGFSSVASCPAPASFVGTLRPYQEEGLGWLIFLQQFGLGGCLADDMGLGKTIQILALLAHHAEFLCRNGKRDPNAEPSLIVVPRSLVFNWQREAKQFAPQLRVLRNTGPSRDTSLAAFKGYDIVLMTYGTVRSDAVQLRNITFHYVILDEAQAIKNASTATAKAARLLKGRHRLALSGTPIENHIGELWSLFEFLNPGMLGSSRVFERSISTDGEIREGARELISRAVRPFVLRRTKSQVAKDLPEKLEETIFCELLPEQRILYDELRTHYRDALLTQPDEQGFKKNKIQVLEALLRLRQVACHPGLVDPARRGEHSAKIDAFIDTVDEVVDSGRKVLAFSQFTSLLSIVRDRLDELNITYEYLDGKTRNREEKVDRFQNDDDCKVFLISLKAGGYGLNLTAAEYVFLLDPWWNPAVESQAIDRAHRIGQKRNVFAYRFIAKDTVEEKVLELQKSKKALADAIIGADNSLIRSLERKDLELLLS